MYSRGPWSLPPRVNDHSFAPGRSRTIAALAEDGKTPGGCSYHPSASACTWICRLKRNENQRGLVDLNKGSTANSTQTSSYSVRVRAPKRRQYEFIPGSFVYTEVISGSEGEDDGDDDDEAAAAAAAAPLFTKTRGRGTRDKPFYLDLDHTEDSPKLDRSLSLLPRAGEYGSPTSGSPVPIFTKGVASEQSGAEIRATWSRPKHASGIESRNFGSSGDGNPLTAPVGTDDRDKKHSAVPEKKHVETWPCEKRKKYLFNDPSRTVRKTIKRHVTSMHSTLDPDRTPRSCWLCPEPGRATSTISRSLTWREHGQLHKVHVNYGILSLMHHKRLTAVQKHGFISCGWHLSHLCGNWTCVNPAHCTVEPGSVNIGRNKCFRDKDGPCEHVPRCLKELKKTVVVVVGDAMGVGTSTASGAGAGAGFGGDGVGRWG